MDRNEGEESYLTVAEVAATLKLNQQTVRNWIDAGTLPALRVGRRVRIKRSDFQRIVDEGYSGIGPEHESRSGPSGDDFWGGEPVGLAEPRNGAGSSEPEPGPEPALELEPEPHANPEAAMRGAPEDDRR